MSRRRKTNEGNYPSRPGEYRYDLVLRADRQDEAGIARQYLEPLRESNGGNRADLARFLRHLIVKYGPQAAQDLGISPLEADEIPMKPEPPRRQSIVEDRAQVFDQLGFKRRGSK